MEHLRNNKSRFAATSDPLRRYIKTTKQMKISIEEIKDWEEFEDLVAGYFREVKNEEESNISSVLVEPSGKGSDGGRDILVTFQVNDSIITYPRKWVIQCKFYDKSISKKHLATVNIPSIIHEYGADGYLLVCKNNPSQKVTEMFENFRKNCRFKYNYWIWEGRELLNRIQIKDNLLKQYFPKYYKFTEYKEREREKKI